MRHANVFLLGFNLICGEITPQFTGLGQVMVAWGGLFDLGIV